MSSKSVRSEETRRSRPLHDASVATRRTLSERQVQTVQRLLDAAFSELVEHGYDDLTVRRVAARADVTPATAYTYFESKEHLIAELFWRRYAAGADDDGDPGAPLVDRLAAVLADFTLTVANETELAAACTVAILANSPEVRALRSRIGGELHRRLAEASGDRLDRAQLQTLELATAGALLQVGTGHLGYEGLPAVLDDVITTVAAHVHEPSVTAGSATAKPIRRPSPAHRGANR